MFRVCYTEMHQDATIGDHGRVFMECVDKFATIDEAKAHIEHLIMFAHYDEKMSIHDCHVILDYHPSISDVEKLWYEGIAIDAEADTAINLAKDTAWDDDSLPF